MTQPIPILVYRYHLLPPSETFIRTQTEALKRYHPYYLGARILKPGLELPAERVIVSNTIGNAVGKLREVQHMFGPVLPHLKQLKAIKPALIHAHFITDAVFAMPYAQHLGIPLVVTLHGYDFLLSDKALKAISFRYRSYIRQKAKLKDFVATFIGGSQFILQTLAEQGYPTAKLTLQPYAVDLDYFTPDETVQREPIVLFVGRLIEKKGARYLIEAMAQIERQHPTVQTVFIGDGIERSALEHLARQHLKRATFLGTQPPEIVRQWMNRARVFCVPSIRAQNNDTETFGVVFAEAQAMKLPPVSFAVGGIPEVIQHGVTGFLAHEKDVGQLSSYLDILLSDSTLWQQFSEAARQNVVRLFDLNLIVQQLEELYDRVLLNKS